MLVNEVLSEIYHVKPLPEGEVAVYKLIKADQDDPSRTDTSTGKKSKCSPTYYLAGKRTIIDKQNKNTSVVIGNVTEIEQRKMPDGKTIAIPVVSDCEFSKGILTVTSDEQATYQFLERINENKDNPFRKSTHKALFYRVNNRKAALKDLESHSLITDALLWIRGADVKELQSICANIEGYSINLDLPYEVIKKQLSDIALKDPASIVRASDHKMAKIKLQALDSIRYQLIMFDEGDASSPRKWFWADGSQDDICVVEIGEDKLDALVTYFTTDEGRKRYKKLVEQLKRILSVQR
jgi:hypothetical protein